jgi:hypothetical protein
MRLIVGSSVLQLVLACEAKGKSGGFNYCVYNNKVRLRAFIGGVERGLSSQETNSTQGVESSTPAFVRMLRAAARIDVVELPVQ